MKKFIRTTVMISAAAFIFASCASTPSSGNKNEKLANGQPKKKVIKLVEMQQTVSKEDSLFEESLKNIKIEVVSSPRFTTSGRKFASPYVIKVTENDIPSANYNISISYPSSKSDDAITYSIANVQTDENGKISWMAEVPSFAANDYVTFYPTPSSSSSYAKQKAFAVAATAPYKVRSSYTASMGVLYAFNINEKDKPTGNNFELLQNLRTKYGINIGNSPIGESSYVNKDIAELYKATYAIVGNAYKFMISSFFRYAEPPIETEEGVTVKLIAEIICVDMKEGKIIFKTSISETTTEINKWTAEQKCKTVLAEKAAEAIVYGM
ncbi:MAG: hypothetical protein UHP28_01410 [Treponema sp.]|nr:hypothetical protein [Treponema sp.]